MALSEATALLRQALSQPLRPGFRLRNAAPPQAWLSVPTADMLQGWYGDGVDVSRLRRSGRQFDSAFDSRRLAEDLAGKGQRVHSALDVAASAPTQAPHAVSDKGSVDGR